jgi:flavin reductase (DIM6/NTAB) family NADH-FMN oxidoreductase RutF
VSDLSAQFRAAMRDVPVPVAVLLAHDGDEVRGATVTSFCSLSVDPPLLAVSVGLARRVHAALRTGSSCTLNVLAAGQEDIAAHFSSSVARETGIHPVRLRRTERGTPLVPGTVVSFDCDAEMLGPRSGQELVVLAVHAVLGSDESDPLLWINGKPAYIS